MITQFTPYQVEDCLFDEKRTLRFAEAIKKIVKKNDVVVDAGSGTGVLGLLAAKAGAKKVYCIESNPRFIPIIKANAKTNGFSKIIQAIYGDASKIKLPGKVNVIIAELMSTGLFYEPQIQVINHLRKYLVKGGKIIPEKICSSLQLVNAKRDLYGLHFDYDARYHQVEGDLALSKEVVFDKIDFTDIVDPELDRRVIVPATRSGLANAVRLYSKAELFPHIWAGESKFLFSPLTIFLDQEARVAAGQNYRVRINYERGSDVLDAIVTVKKSVDWI